MKSKRVLSNQKGFTLIEIIAVLVILGILAAVAVPKYLDLQAEAKVKAAQGQVAEVKGTLNSAWGKLMLSTGGTATTTGVITKSGLPTSAGNIGTAPDIWSVSVGNTGVVNVYNRDNDTGYHATGQWNKPAN